jgi:FKBP-type peptidyl-prolyl cis-trans isomerase
MAVKCLALSFAPLFKNNMQKIKNFSLVFAGLAVAIGFSALQSCQTPNFKEPVKANLKTNADSASYALGAQLGQSLKRDGLDTLLNIKALMDGIQNGMLDKSGMDEGQITQTVQNFFQGVMEKRNEGLKAEGDAFLAENGKKQGITTTESGLQYEVIQQGTGPKPGAESTVSVYYKGTQLNGNVFDQSQEGSPVEFPVNRVIPGWIEGIQLMPVGSKYKFYIPSDLAYGPMGSPQGGIGPNEVLIFEVELLGIK